MKLIIDLMGNDHGPKEVMHGIIDSMDKTEITYVLSGPENIAKEIINERKADISRFEFINTDEFITNEDDPARSIRSKKDSSLVLGLNRLNEECDGLLSSGSTGALVAGGLLITKRIKNIQRATLLTYVPNQKNKFTVMVDSGAVVDTKPEMLEQFALMGSIVAEKNLGIKNPKVYLLNIGSEEGKGDSRAKEAYDLLVNNEHINFAGNIEARDFLTGKADVIVADGFAGNVMIKTTEGVAATLFSEIKESVNKSIFTKLGALLMKSGLKGVKDKYDYNKAGAGVLVGINKPLFKAHGSSNRKAMEHAIYKAIDYINGDIVNIIKERVWLEIELLKW